jgi:transketolase
MTDAMTEAMQAQMENVFTEADSRAARANVFGQELIRLASEHPEVVLLSADLGAAVGDLRRQEPHRYVELGIAETNAVSVAAGMAACGQVPYVLAMGPFSAIKTAEQIRTDAAYTKLPLRILARLSGLAMGYFGTSHHAIEDIAITRSITNLTVVAPSDDNSSVALLRSTFDHPGPVFFRMSEGLTRSVYPDVPTIERGQTMEVRPGSDVTVVATGVGVSAALGAAETLAGEGISVGVLDAAYLKPLDEETIVGAARGTGAVLTVEEHNVVGGLGTAVAEVLARHQVPARVRLFGLPDVDLEVATPAVLLEHYGLTPEGVTKEIRELLGK